MHNTGFDTSKTLRSGARGLAALDSSQHCEDPFIRIVVILGSASWHVVIRMVVLV